MRRTYYERDSTRGAHATALWLASELGEFIDALIKEDEMRLKEEAADVLAWFFSLCNLLGVNVEEAFVERYGAGCPRCCRTLCTCSM